MLGFWLWDSRDVKLSSADISEVNQEESAEENGENAPTAEGNEPTPTVINTTDKNIASISDLKDVLDRNFAHRLVDLGKCLDIQADVIEDKVPPTVDNLVNSIKRDLGESVVQTEDWSNTQILLPDGEKRNIRIEVDFNSDEKISRRLKYYSVQEDQVTKSIPLPEDQIVEPSDSFVASLEKDGQIVSVEKAQRIYFANGEELSILEKNNMISSAELSRNGKSFKCTDLDTETGNCRCL